MEIISYAILIIAGIALVERFIKFVKLRQKEIRAKEINKKRLSLH